jgi:hypothetical protein
MGIRLMQAGRKSYQITLETTWAGVQSNTTAGGKMSSCKQISNGKVIICYHFIYRGMRLKSIASLSSNGRYFPVSKHALSTPTSRRLAILGNVP